MKAVVTVNRSTKKQNKIHFSKSLNLTKYYVPAFCPAMSKYVRLCPKNRTEFLTFRREDFFAVIPGSVAVAGIFLSSLIKLTFAPDPATEEAIKAYGDYIAKQVLATSLEVAQLADDAAAEVLDIDGTEVKVLIELNN